MEKGDKGSTMIRMGVSGWMFLLVPAYPGCPGSKAVKRSSLLLLYWCHVLEQMLFCSYFCSWNFVIVIPLFIECGNFFRFLLYWKAVLVSSSIHTLFLLQSLWWHRHTQLFIGHSVNQDLLVLWCCWLGVRKSIRPVKFEWWGVGVVIYLEWGADCLHMVQLMPLHPKSPSSLASFKSRLLYHSSTFLPRFSWKRSH